MDVNEATSLIDAPFRTAHISKKTQPRDQMSAEELRASHAATSGAPYLGVIAVGPTVVLWPKSVQSTASPKSVKYGSSFLIRMFCGLMSLCRILLSCRNANAEAKQPKYGRMDHRFSVT